MFCVHMTRNTSWHVLCTHKKKYNMKCFMYTQKRNKTSYVLCTPDKKRKCDTFLCGLDPHKKIWHIHCQLQLSMISRLCAVCPCKCGHVSLSMSIISLYIIWAIRSESLLPTLLSSLTSVPRSSWERKWKCSNYCWCGRQCIIST